MKIWIASMAMAMSLGTAAQSGSHIEYKISSTKGYTGTSSINYSEYGYRSEFNMSVPQKPGGGTMTIITLYKKETPDMFYMINDKDKAYTEMKKQQAKPKDDKTCTVKKLGDEVVNGYKCTHALVTEGMETSEVWNTKDIADYSKYAEAVNSNKRFGSDKRQEALKEAGCDGFMVKMMRKGDPRDGDLTIELTKMEKKTFTKSDFEIPAGYVKSDSQVSPPAMQGMKSQQEIMNMTPEERAKYIEEMKKKYGKE